MTTGSRPRLLVIDDDARTTRLLARMLREDGFDVEVALDGAVAIGRLGRSPMPDLVITDILMLHGDGVSIARYARWRAPGIPVILLTGHPELVPIAENALLPSPTVLTKPLEYARLRGERRRITSAPAIDSGRAERPLRYNVYGRGNR